ncbi:MAG: DUF2791 family P-loop domain-containing protein [bacterium]|nr:DUF2791 family P-loop domain-containing protein [bacterium]
MPTYPSQNSGLEPMHGKVIINQLGGTGTPPEFGVEHFTVGLSPYLRLLEEEYLESFIKMGGSAFKLVIGNYGGGKTHFLYCVRDIAWKMNYVVSYVPLSPTECPFNRLELVYKSIMANLMYPRVSEELTKHYEKGIDPFIRSWYVTKMEELKESKMIESYVRSISGIESSSFENAVRHAFLTLQEDNSSYNGIIQWLKGEEVDREIRNRFGITEKLDKTTAFRLIRSLAQYIREIGYSGIILLFDEAERGMSIATSREKRMALDNLRQLIDECGNVRLPGVMIFYAIPDERQLLEERLEVYEALRQRLSGTISRVNPSGVRIQLEHLELSPPRFLTELGERLGRIYEIAYSPFSFDRASLKKTISVFAEGSFEERYADVGYRRVFVKSVIQGFHMLKENPRSTVSKKDAQRIIRDEIRDLERDITAEAEEEEF